jgi:pyruvate, water dikinase
VQSSAKNASENIKTYLNRTRRIFQMKSTALKPKSTPHFPISPNFPIIPEELLLQASNRKPFPTEVTVAQQTQELGQPFANAKIHEIPLAVGATLIPDRATFEQLASRDDVPGALGVREVKFLISQVDTTQPIVYFLNTQNFQFHYLFARDGLGLTLSNQEFNLQTYFTDNRKFIAGTLLAHDGFASEGREPGLYALEFWPTDPVKVEFVNLAFQSIRAAIPFATDILAYHPAGETQQSLYKIEKAEFERLGIRTVSTEELFGSITYSPLNLGEGYGRLRLMDPSDSQPPTVRDIVIFKQLPNDLTHVAGVLTEEPQTPLSHINLKAKQNNTPNAYLKEAANDPRVAPLLDKLVYLKVAADSIEIREATQTEVDEFLEQVRPKESQIPPRNLCQMQIVDLDSIGHGDLKAYGAKAANVAELRKVLSTPGLVPDGFAVPFYFYHRFMAENGLYGKAYEMIMKSKFQEDPQYREQQLKEFRDQIESARMPKDLFKTLGKMHKMFPPDQPIRCRSSTNNEDLEGFNGAGLYDSFTHREDEGHIEKSIKQVWASLWNYRAFEEREFYRIDHFTTAMGVLVHPNFDDELVNGVGLTRNIFDPNWEGYYVNVQVGEALVTNPDAGAVPDEFLVMRTLTSVNPPKFENETIFIRHSNLIAQGQQVLRDDQIEHLIQQMRAIQSHFQTVYQRQEDPTFAMDIEFKIDGNGQLVIKQARPWVD